jgi:hypothetical protein
VQGHLSVAGDETLGVVFKSLVSAAAGSMEDVAIADSGFELGRNFEGATETGGDILTSSSSTLLLRVEASDAIPSSSSSWGCIFLDCLLGGGCSEPLDSPFLLLEAAEWGGRVFTGLFFFEELYSVPEADPFSWSAGQSAEVGYVGL